jgi:hypothetical protein
MARDFNGSTDVLSWANQGNPAAGPITVSLLVRFDTLTGDRNIFTLRDSGGNDKWVFGSTGSAVFVEKFFASGSSYRTGATGLSTGQLYHFLIHTTANVTATEYKIFRDGTEESYSDTFTGSGAANANDGNWRLGLGGYGAFDGVMSEAALWTRELSAGEIAGLAKRLSPGWYRQNLTFHAPLLRDDTNRITGVAASVTGTAEAVHPSVIYPVGSSLIVAAGGATPEVDGIVLAPTATDLQATSRLSVAAHWTVRK